MSENIFDEIDKKIVEIMNLIEKEDGFPLFKMYVEEYINGNKDKARLYEIYSKISLLRSF